MFLSLSFCSTIETCSLPSLWRLGFKFWGIQNIYFGCTCWRVTTRLKLRCYSVDHPYSPSIAQKPHWTAYDKAQ